MAPVMTRRKVVEATESHAVEIDGEAWLIRKGERVASNHPAVRANPQLFTESGGATLSNVKPEKPEPKPSPPQPESMMRAKREMVFRASALRDGTMFIREGDILPRSHPAVKDRPKDFERIR
jgi:hypothetical protein